MSQSAISTAALVKGLSLMRKSINRRSAVSWVGSLPTRAGPIRLSSAATQLLLVSPLQSADTVASPTPTSPRSVCTRTIT